jgi:hypothetical protein
MRRISLIAGILLSALGIFAIGASIVMSYLGMDPSYNFGDPAKSEFVLIPFWQIGAAIGVAGVACILLSRRLTT